MKKEEKPKDKDTGSPRASLENTRSPGWEYDRVHLNRKPGSLNLEPVVIWCFCPSATLCIFCLILPMYSHPALGPKRMSYTPSDFWPQEVTGRRQGEES